MKKICIVTFSLLLVSLMLTECQKEQGLSFKSLKMNEELESLYKQMPAVSFDSISTIYNGEILRFESEEQYEYVYETLLNRCNSWTNLFINNYDYLTDQELNEMSDSLGFDDNTPLEEFENSVGFYNNLRNLCEQHLDQWANQGNYTTPPSDSIIICPIEQTLYSVYHEVCIKDTIYQLRPNCSVLMISVKDIDLLQDIRNISDVDLIIKLYPSIVVYKGGEDGCYNNHWFKQHSRVNPNDPYKMFSFSFQYGKARVGHKYKTKITMNNYRLRLGKWKKDLIISGVSSSMELYKYVYDNSSCNYYYEDSILMGFPCKKRAWSKTKKTLPVACIDDPLSLNWWHPIKIEIEGIHINPSNSYIECYYDSLHYRYNLSTMVETVY